MDIYTTSVVPRRARATYWNEVYTRRFAQVTFEPLDPHDFEAELRVGSAGPVSIARVCSQPAGIERNSAHISRTGARLFAFILQLRGNGVFSHYGHNIEMGEGDFTLSDNAAPHRLASSVGTEVIIFRTSPDVLRTYLPVPEQLCGLCLPAGQALTSTVAYMARRLWDLVESNVPETGRAMFARNVLDAMATAYAMAFDASISKSAIVSGRKMQAKCYIDTHLSDPDLTPGSIAKALGISGRYLRMLFDGEKESASRLILRRRLEESAKHLSSVLWYGRTITEIALSCGFNSPAHFTRAFRHEYGVTPRQFRRAKLACHKGN